MWLIYLIQNIMHKGISYNVSGLFFIAVVGQGKMKCQSGVFWAVGNCKGVISLCPHNLGGHSFSSPQKRSLHPFDNLLLGFTVNCPFSRENPALSYKTSSLYFCYYQNTLCNFLCPQSGMNSLLSNSSLLTLCERPRTWIAALFIHKISGLEKNRELY